ncbi:hypothetical protein K0M31_014792 [Melipona bicolor]|uniref:Uncharacterized protein n=1 Tax=Melipona bicolor TaxID=60889 RepID=A0AA40FGV8_9HYME|nr:hypothetical protein K0M31_014792 [Melipona bicolor]
MTEERTEERGNARDAKVTQESVLDNVCKDQDHQVTLPPLNASFTSKETSRSAEIGKKRQVSGNAIAHYPMKACTSWRNGSKEQGRRPRGSRSGNTGIEDSISIDVAGIVSFGLSVRNGQAAGGPATRPNTHRELLIL